MNVKKSFGVASNLKEIKEYVSLLFCLKCDLNPKKIEKGKFLFDYELNKVLDAKISINCTWCKTIITDKMINNWVIMSTENIQILKSAVKQIYEFMSINGHIYGATLTNRLLLTHKFRSINAKRFQMHSNILLYIF